MSIMLRARREVPQELGAKKKRSSSMSPLLNLPDALKEEIVEYLLSGSERNAEHRKLAIRAMKRL